MMKRILFSLITILLILSIRNTFAIEPMEVVYDPTVDADIIQTFSFFETEIKDLEDQINALDKAVKLLTSGKYLWNNTNTIVNQLNHTLEQANGLSYTAKNEASEFASLFPGYTVLNNFNEQYQKLTKSSLDTLNNILQALQISANNFLTENSRLTSLQNFTEGVEGQTQAIQMTAQLASEQVSQLQLLRQSILAQANAQVVYYAQEIQKQAGAIAEFNTWLSAGNTKITGNLANHPLIKPQYE